MGKAFIPVFFSKIGKDNKDELDSKKKYPSGKKLEIVSKTKGGLKITSETTADGECVCSSLKGEVDVFDKNAKLEVEGTTERLKLFSISSEKLLDGLKLTSKAENDKKAGKSEILECSFEALYKAEYFTVGGTFKNELEHGKTSISHLLPSLTVGSDGVTVGGEVKLNASGELKDYNVGLQLDANDATFHAKTEDSLKVVKVGFLHRVSPSVKFTGLYSHDRRDEKVKHGLEAGLWHELSNDTEVRGKVHVTSAEKDNACFNGSYGVRLNENARLSLTTKFSLVNLESADPKFGFKLQLGEL